MSLGKCSLRFAPWSGRWALTCPCGWTEVSSGRERPGLWAGCANADCPVGALTAEVRGYTIRTLMVERRRDMVLRITPPVPTVRRYPLLMYSDGGRTTLEILAPEWGETA